MVPTSLAASLGVTQFFQYQAAWAQFFAICQLWELGACLPSLCWDLSPRRKTGC